MTSTIARYQPPTNGARPASQATSIEQSRAIADVQAAVTVAQNCPRDMAEAEREMEYVCGRLSVAETAFYTVKNRGTGPSVHLMRELARILGNVDYGVKELARDDQRGESEVLATCWDMQKNTRSSRTFIVPHQRMANGARTQLVDLQDIYLNNQNIGARAVRECIETILPKWFVQKAIDTCKQTLANGEGEPLQDRIQKMVVWFRDKLGVSQQQLEAHVDRKRGSWTADDVAQLKIAGKSITAGEIGRDEVFPPIAADEVSEIACDTDADEKPAESKLAGKVKKAGKPKAEVTDDAPQSEPNPEPTPEAEPEPPADPPAKPEPTPAAGAPTAKTPGQTDRVAAALNKASKGGAQQAMADMIDNALAKVNVTDPEDIRAIASQILKTEIGDGTALDLKQLKTVQDTIFAWQDLGTLEAMVTDAINIADARSADRAEDGGAQ